MGRLDGKVAIVTGNQNVCDISITYLTSNQAQGQVLVLVYRKRLLPKAPKFLFATSIKPVVMQQVRNLEVQSVP
jgi:hypothetical protein